jgi:glycosyltransferase involved in cell wall biosynthesis
MTPILSILIPTYNRVKYLKIMLNSVIIQVERDNLTSQVEVIISDNASDDGTKDYIGSLSSEKPFIRYSRNEKNIGVVKNIIKLFELTNGKYWMFYGDDDIIPEGALVKVIKVLSENPDIPLTIFAQRGYTGIKENKKISVHEAVSKYFYYMGNMCTACKTDFLKENLKKYYDKIATTCWPQTHVILLEAASHKMDKPIMLNTLEVYDFQSPDDNNVKNAFYFYEAGFFSLMRLAYMVSDETNDKDLIAHAKHNTKNMSPYSFIFFCLDNTFSHHFVDLPKEQEDYKAIIKESKTGLRGNHRIYAQISDFARKIPLFIFKPVYMGLNIIRMKMRGVSIKDTLKEDRYTIRNGRADKLKKLEKKHAIALSKGEW